MKNRPLRPDAQADLNAEIAPAVASMIEELDRQIAAKTLAFDKAVTVRALTLAELRVKLELALWAAEQIEDGERVLRMLKSCIDDLPDEK